MPDPDPATPAGSLAPSEGPQPLTLPAGLHQLCRCGRSRHGWLCDGAHLGSGQVSFELRLAEETTLQLCGCGRSRRYPLCDGRHRQTQRRSWWRWWG